MKSLSDQLREILANDERTINAIAKESGIPQPVLYRFYSDKNRSMNLSTVEKLFRYYQLKIVKPK